MPLQEVPPADALDEVPLLFDDPAEVPDVLPADVAEGGDGTVFMPGIATPVLRGVTEALTDGRVTCCASEGTGVFVVVDLVAIPSAKAIANGTTSATSNNSHLTRTAGLAASASRERPAPYASDPLSISCSLSANRVVRKS